MHVKHVRMEMYTWMAMARGMTGRVIVVIVKREDHVVLCKIADDLFDGEGLRGEQSDLIGVS